MTVDIATGVIYFEPSDLKMFGDERLLELMYDDVMELVTDAKVGAVVNPNTGQAGFFVSSKAGPKAYLALAEGTLGVALYQAQREARL